MSDFAGQLPRRVPGHPDFHYFVGGGLWLWHATAGFVACFATRADLRAYFAG